MEKKKKKLILASSSPRRRAILEKMELDFEIILPDYEEVLDSFDFSYEKIEKLAYNKAKSVLDKVKEDSQSFNFLILSADTVVVLDGKILGKPADEADAINMLKMLSGKKHSVVTSICVLNCENFESKILSTTSYVEFHLLEDEFIKDYVEKYKPLDKAGSYGIQELPDGFLNCIEGSFENIIGLCSNSVKKALTL